MSDRTKRQVFEMCAGVVVHNLIVMIVCLIWFRNVSTMTGVLVGAALAIGLLISIAYSTELCVESGSENYAKKKMAAHAVLRSLTVVAVLGVLWRLTNINLLTVVLGILGMKTGAYLYPFMHKILNRGADQTA